MSRSTRFRRHAALLAVLIASVLGRSGLADEPFGYFLNSWSVIGLKDYRDASRITPSNEILLANNAKLNLRCGRNLIPLSRRHMKTLMDGWMPIVELRAEEGDVAYEFTLWSTPLPTVADWRNAFDWPSQGENFLNWITVDVSNTGSTSAEAKVQVERINAASPVPRTSAWTLAAGERTRAVFRIPYAPAQDEADFASQDAKLWLARTREFWEDCVAKSARIQVPCRKANEALLAAHVCQMIANDHGEMHAGEGFYDHFYIRDAAYQVMQLEEAGFWDAAEKAIAYYLQTQRTDGRFESQKGQLDANGQACWTLWQYFTMTADRDWLAKVYPRMYRAVDWTMKTRREAPAGSPFAGLLPAALADGEYLWDGKHHIVGYDFWNLRGILCTARAAGVLGKADDERRLLAEADDYRAAIDAAWKRTGVSWFPPSWEAEGTHWGNTETIWPTPIFPHDDARVAALIDHVRHEHGGGYVEGTIQWRGRPDAIHPYMGAYTTMASMRQGDHEQTVEDFYWYLLHSSASHAFPEGIYYKRRFAWSNTIPHALGAANYAILLRHMLVDERGGELHLLSAVPDGWLNEGQEIRVERAPTQFGLMDLVVRGTANGVQVTFDPPRRQQPNRVVLHLPKSRPLDGRLDGVEVVLRNDQKKQWDFPAVVELYRKVMPVSKPIPGLIEWPWQAAAPEDRCVTFDLTDAANTDPRTAPFGVEHPTLRFTGMPVGRQIVAGVPFRIINPGDNDDRGLIVLHSPKAPKDRQWPREIEVSVKQKGKRLFFLGNVHGWSSQDPGTGPWGAVAEYVIYYADGNRQVVPLITGRTADEWTSSGGTDDVYAYAGLSGQRWHLNVLAVTLRDVTVDKVVFRDLGTPAAPVLAAMTLEKLP